MTRLGRPGSIGSGSRRLPDSRRVIGLRPWLEGLEDRLVLSTITWNTTVAPTGGNWDTGSNWIGGLAPAASDDAVIDLTSTGTVTLSSNQADAVHSLVTNAETTLKVENGSLTLGVGSSTLGGPVNVAAGATLGVGAGASVLISYGQTLTDNGTLSFASGDAVTLGASGYGAAYIVVSGTVTAAGATFTSPGNAGSTITVNSGGIINPSGSTFNLPLFVPYNDVQDLSNNTSFDQIEINSTTLASGTVNLDLIGTNTSKLSYVFPAAFTVGPGGTLAVGDNVPVLIQYGQTLTDSGTLSFAAGDAVTLGASGYGAAYIVVSGTMTAAGATFTSPGNAGSTVTVDSGGLINPSGTTFNLPLFVPYNDVQDLAGNTSFDQIEIDSGTLSSGTVNLDLIGTNTTNLSYVFPAAFTVGTGGTLAVGANVPVLFQYGQTLTDNGTLSFASGDAVTLGASGYGAAYIVVSGTVTAAGATFTSPGNAGSTITVNSGGIINPSGSTFNLPLFVPYNDVQDLAGNTSFDQIEIDSGTLSSGTVNLDLIGTNTSNLSYVFPAAFTVGPGGTLAVGANVPVLIQYGQTLTDNGMLSFAAGDAVTLGASGYGAAYIVVSGTMTATGTTFSSPGNAGSTITVDSGGLINPSGSTFNLPLFVPYGDVQDLTANLSFDQIEINAGTLSSGTLNLDLIGTNTSHLSYVFPAAFTVGPGGTLAVGANVPVLIQYGQTLTDNGMLSFAAGDAVTLGASGYGPAYIVASGIMTASGTTFTSPGNAGSTITVDSGGLITPSGSTFNLPLFVPYGDVQDLNGNLSFDQIEIDSGTLSSGTLNLNLIGTNTSNLSYVFPAAFTVGPGGTLAVGANVPVLIQYGQTLTDNGMLSFAAGDAVTLGASGYGPAYIVASGIMTASGTTFTSPGNAGSTITVDSGGLITPRAARSTCPSSLWRCPGPQRQPVDQIEIDSRHPSRAARST